MIIDFHTHIFPPRLARSRNIREEYARRDPTFAEMYADPEAKIATAEDLLTSMDEAGVDVSIALGFAWQSHGDIVRHNDYLRQSAAESNGRIIAFPCINMGDPGAAEEIVRHRDRCCGLGELRPDSQNWDLLSAKGQLLANVAGHMTLLFHVTEPGDRTYPGRMGCSVEAFRTYVDGHHEHTIVGAHLGGSIFQLDNPSSPNLYVDTAAQPFLYPGDDAAPAMRAVPPGHLLFGSDFPLISQKRQIDEITRVFPDADERAAVLGGNAAKLLRLS